MKHITFIPGKNLNPSRQLNIIMVRFAGKHTVASITQETGGYQATWNGWVGPLEDSLRDATAALYREILRQLNELSMELIVALGELT